MERVRAARAAIDKSGGDVIFTARTEGFIKGLPDLDETIRRLKAFADAGADCLYAPGIKTREQIEAVVKAVAPKPVNLLMSAASGFSVKEIAAMGVRRISVGGTLARVAMHAFIKSAKEIADAGTFDRFAGVISNAELNAVFSADRKTKRHERLRTASRDRAAGRETGRYHAGATSRPVTLTGRYGRLEKMEPRHAADLWSVFTGHDDVWAYIADGPFSNETEFAEFIARRAAANDPYAYAIVEPKGRASATSR